jgi:hypothetical protein
MATVAKKQERTGNSFDPCHRERDNVAENRLLAAKETCNETRLARLLPFSSLAVAGRGG